MRYYESDGRGNTVISFLFWREFGKNVKHLREKSGMTRGELAKNANVAEGKIGRIERAEIRTELPLMQKLASLLGSTVDVLVEADHDSKTGNCLYLVWGEYSADFKLYQRARSAQEAYLLTAERLRNVRVRWLDKGEAAFVELVGTPIDAEAIKRRFPEKLEGDEAV